MSRELLALAGKDIRLLLRDKGGAFVTFVFPFVYCVFFGLIFAVRTGGRPCHQRSSGRSGGLVVGSSQLAHLILAASTATTGQAGARGRDDLLPPGNNLAFGVNPNHGVGIAFLRTHGHGKRATPAPAGARA